MTRGVRRFAPLGAVFLFALLGQGCATVATLGGQDQKVKITTDPPGAAVTIDGQPLGVTPVALPLARKTEHQVEIAAPGYETARLTIRRKINPWMLGNLVVGGLLGVAIDVVTDASHYLSPDELEVKLQPLGVPAGTPVGTPMPR